MSDWVTNRLCDRQMNNWLFFQNAGVGPMCVCELKLTAGLKC